ncbi:hypothetical protein COOONC_23917, partial [Cooperia oncophora]
GGDGYNFNITVILQFHPIIITRADQGLEVSCFYQQPLSPQEITRVAKNIALSKHLRFCTYRIHRYSPTQCVALDAKVGETLFHKWQCDSLGPELSFFVSFRCEIDHHFLETPNYSRLGHPQEETYVFQEMSVFKFPGEGDVYFQCKISLCDMEGGTMPCTKQVPPRCSKRTPKIAFREKRSASPTDSQSLPVPPILNVDQTAGNPSRMRSRRNIAQTKKGFYMTLDVETR